MEGDGTCMNRIKRILIKLTRNKKSTIITLFLFVLIFSVILSVQLIAQNVTKIRNITNSTLQPVVILSSSYTLQENDDNKDMEIVPLTSQAVTLMEKHEEVESVNYSYEAVSYNELKKYVAAGQDEVPTNSIEMKGSEIGVPEFSTIREESIVSGVKFSASDIENGEQVVIIHKHYAELNALEVGDTLVIKSKIFKETEDVDKEKEPPLEWEETIPLTVIGIVTQLEEEPEQEQNESDADFQQRSINYAQTENIYYVPNKLINEMNSNKNAQLSDDDIRKHHELQIPVIYIKLQSLESQASFVENVQKDLQFPWMLITSEEMVSTIIQPFKYIENLFGVGMIISFLLFLFIMLLLILYQLRERSSELGLYLALGETKQKIITMILGEYVCLGLISMFVSTIFMKSLETQMNDTFILNQLLAFVGEEQVGSLQNINFMESKIQNQLLDAFDIMKVDDSSSMYIIYAATIFLLALFIAIGFMYIYIKKINPKKILMDH